MDEETLTTLVVADLRADGFEVTEPPEPPKPTPAPRPSGTQTSQIPEWVERLADVLALIVSAFAIMQAGSWFGKDNFIVAIAMGAAIVFLVGNYNGPLRQWLRAIFTELILTIVTLVEAIGKFFEAAGKYYGGNFARMVLELVLVPVALGLVADFLRYPAVRDVVDFLKGVIRDATKLTEQAIAFTQEGIADLRHLLTTTVGDLLAYLPQELGRFRGAITADLDRVFAAAERRVARVEAQIATTERALVSFMTSATAGLHLRLDILGVRVDGMPETVRAYLNGILTDRGREFMASVPPTPEGGPIPPAVIAEALAATTAAIDRAAAGEQTPQTAALAAVQEGIRTLTSTAI